MRLFSEAMIILIFGCVSGRYSIILVCLNLIIAVIAAAAAVVVVIAVVVMVIKVVAAV